VNDFLIQAALNTKDIERNPIPYVFKNKIDDTTIQYQLNAFTLKPEHRYFIISDLNENILKIFHENNIDLMSPKFFPKPQNHK